MPTVYDIPTAYDMPTAYAALDAPRTKAFRLPPAAKRSKTEFLCFGPTPA